MSASDLQKKAIAKNIPVGLPTPFKPKELGDKTMAAKSKRERFAPRKWDEYFERKERVSISATDKFNVYRKGSETDFALVLLHGGGYSGLTWACFAKEVFELMTCQIIAPDLRGHGESMTGDDYDLSADKQAEDVGKIIEAIFDGKEKPPIFLIGHSMGGAIAVQAAFLGLLPSLIALSVIDVVEGSALEALRSMQTVLICRPVVFQSVEQAIEWSLRSGQTRNPEAAKISMPSQIVKLPSSSVAQSSDPPVESLDINEEAEEEELEASAEDSDGFKTPAAVPGKGSSRKEESGSIYGWRIDLSKTEKYWTGWFEGLSNKFLGVSVPKLLLLAGVDRLDKDLTTAQMQGKFQLMVLPKVGHAIQEDSPERVAEVYASFCVRNKFAQAKRDFKPVFPGC